MNKNIFVAGSVLTGRGLLAPVAPPGVLIHGFTLTHSFHVESKRPAKFLLQASVVALGFGMNLH